MTSIDETTDDTGRDATPTLRFDGEVAVVTGAGNGLGRAYALELAARGAAVVCNDLVPDAAMTTARDIDQGGGRAVADTTEVGAPGAGEAITQAALDAFGSVEIVVNNAGQLRNAPFEEMTAEDFDAVLGTHLRGAFDLTQAAYKQMMPAGYGRIVFTSSASVFGMPWSANYAAAKGGLIGLSNVVALEGAAHGIQANAILPMSLSTSMGDHGRVPYSPEYLDELLGALMPIVGELTAENVAPLVTYLCHRRCEVTGRMFSVAAGRSAEVIFGTGLGWYAADPAHATAEDLADNIAAVCDLSSPRVLGSAIDDIRLTADGAPSLAAED